MISDTIELTFIREDSPDDISDFGTVTVLVGQQQASYQISPQIICSGRNTTIKLEKKFLFDNTFSKMEKPFDSQLVRVILPYDWSHCYLGKSGETNPPKSSDYPSKKILFYGSSITHGSSSNSYLDSYVFKLSSKLNYEGTNLGFAGSCFCESNMAKYILTQRWDILILELGVNMLDWKHSEFEEKTRIFLELINSKKLRANEKIYCVGIFRNKYDENHEKNTEQFREILKKNLSLLSNIQYIDGYNLLNDKLDLSTDGIHPSISGMESISKSLIDEIVSS